ncbi:hypothetical protein OCL06_15020 [Alteromonas sp. ASW11-19]|uniref:DUF3955 domain-containing protein n=1 Tax=Alteromonas salexigens TaxID=2982530 RepID=A0ABT2VVM3_9ALTE|nr:hypothetical protein [Alteromonas salexigens]MCU7555899.1 hypothetical protein [Alteromonas salexigens]
MTSFKILVLLSGFLISVGLGGLLMYATALYLPELNVWQELLCYTAIGAGVGAGAYRLCIKPALSQDSAQTE